MVIYYYTLNKVYKIILHTIYEQYFLYHIHIEYIYICIYNSILDIRLCYVNYICKFPSSMCVRLCDYIIVTHSFSCHHCQLHASIIKATRATNERRMLKHEMRAVNSINYNNKQHVRTAQTPPIGQHPRFGTQRTDAKAIIRQPTGDV